MEKLALFPQIYESNMSKVRLSIFFPEEDRPFTFSMFKVRIFISKKCQPPPPLRIKWLPLEQRTIFRRVTIFRHLFLICCNFCICYRKRLFLLYP